MRSLILKAKKSLVKNRGEAPEAPLRQQRLTDESVGERILKSYRQNRIVFL